MLEQLISGRNQQSGVYRGETSADNFITGAELAALVGLSEGALTYNDTSWLQFKPEGKTLFIPRRPIRNNLKWTTLSSLGAADGSKIVTIKGKNYKVRLMSGLTSDPGSTLGGEYLDLLMRVTTAYPGPGAPWHNFSLADMGYTAPGTANGGITLVREAHNGGANRRAGVGYPTFGGVWYQNTTSTNASYGWRPVLELVE